MSKYQGEELDLFKYASNWKKYVSSFILPLTNNRDVLEVGSGIGTFTQILRTNGAKSWTCLEPDAQLMNQHLRLDDKRDDKLRLLQGDLIGLGNNTLYDLILYLDVLEHIENDRKELEYASNLLNPGGVLIVLAPAHQFLFSNFDKSIGHFRRYNSKMLKDITPKSLQIVEIKYLDSIGVLLSAANAVILKQNYPTIEQIKFWDNYVVTLSKFIDPIFRYKLGKSIFCFWRK